MKIGLYLGTALLQPPTASDALLAILAGVALGILASLFV